MILHESRDKIEDLMSFFVHKVKCASAMGRTDIKKDAETILTPLLATVYDYNKLRNLNATERSNFPAIDLADDEAGVAFQITSQKDLEKVKKTLRMFVDYELYDRYKTLFFYVLTEKQGSYSVAPCNEIVQGKFDFDPNRDVLDYQDLLKKIGGFEVGKTNSILEILEANIGESKTFQGIVGHSPISKEIVDEHIEKEINLLRKARFFPEFSEIEYASLLGTRVLEGEYQSGTNSAKARALVWCARILSANEEELHRAEEYIRQAKIFGGDTRIADAFICSRRGNRNAALKLLADVPSTDSRSAAYRSASFKIVEHHDGPKKAISWLEDVRFDPRELDPDGKLVLLHLQLELGYWKAAVETAKVLGDGDFEEAPVLHYMKAMAYLLDTLPEESRESVNQQVPFEAAGFAMDSRAKAIEARRTARSHFAAAAQVARELNCHRAATVPDRYALWLELEDWEHCDRGKQRFAARLGDLESAFYLVPLALQYGIPLELDKVEQEIERQIALQGEVSPDAASARLALAFMQKTHEAVANYIGRHFDSIASLTDTTAVLLFQAEFFALAEKPESANEVLEKLRKEGISQVQESRLVIAMARAEGRDTLEDRMNLFRQTDSIVDLRNLVREAETERDWKKLIYYGKILFERTQYVRDAERVAKALHLEGKSAQAIELIESNVDFLPQSRNLQMCYCWSLYHEGKLIEAHLEMAKLDVDLEDEYYRKLRVNLAVALGDWNSLSVYVAKEYHAKEARSARELIGAAQLALSVNSPYAKQLALAAAARDDSDADVFASVYFLASNAGWESDPQFVRCLHKAVELSGDDGPILKYTLKDILDRKLDWDRQESSARELLSRGEVPMVYAGLLLNKSLINLMLFPALANSSERDLRRKVSISAFSGQRQDLTLEPSGTVGLDYTTLLTLNFLGVLDKVFDAFDTVYVPHSALAWLFEERQNASFHQPSRIEDARHVLHLVATGSLEKLTPGAVANRELSDYVGDDLATFIAEAENTMQGDTQRLVVRPFPVYEAASLGRKEADLTRHSSVLVSCQAIVEKLSHLAEILGSVEENALAYLRLKEKPWPNQPEIDDDAVLYLDDLTVYYFLHTGMLDLLCKQDFKLIVSSGLVSELSALVGYELISDMVIDAIENMRSVIRQGIECGNVKVGKWRNISNGDEQYLNDFQMAGLFALAEDCEAIIADDRFINQSGHIEHKDVKASLYTTLDILDALVSAGQICDDYRLECRAKLRHAGYFFVPVDEDELAFHLNAAETKNGEVIETARLRAIRESILCVRMTDWLQLPNEVFWLYSVFEVFVNVLRSHWTESAGLPRAEACSNWILDQIDVRGWAHCFGLENREETIKSVRTQIISKLITSLPAGVPPDVRESYWSWVEEFVLIPVKELEPDLYSLIVDLVQRHFSEIVNTSMKKEGKDAE